MSLRQNRRSALGWIVAVAVLTLVYAGSYPSIGKTKASAIANYPPTLTKALNLQDLSTAVGYVSATVFGILLLALVTVYVIGAGTRAIAGDEEAGVLDVLLTHPVSRTMLVLQRSAGMFTTLVGMGAAVFLALLAVRSPAQLSISVANIAAATVQWVLLGATLGALTVMFSAASGRRTFTIGASATLSVVAYLADTFLPLVKRLGWINNISPYHWFNAGEPLRNGLQPADCAYLITATVVALVVAVAVFDRRDLRV